MDNRKILVIYTGGTIGMVMDAENNALKPFEFKNIHQQLPMLHLVEADLTFEEMLPLIDSSDTNPDFWIRLAQLIKRNYEYYDGFVVLHGTDTMAFTASALSFLLENLAKPVILTGSQLPLGVIRTDGRRNILNSIAIAAEYIDNHPVIQEVCIYFQNNLYRGNRTYKDDASRFNAFSSPNFHKLADVNTNVEYHVSDALRADPDKPFVVHDKMDDSVAIIKLFPGMRPSRLSSFLDAPDLHAIVLETFGVGNAPTSPEFIDTLKRAVDRGMTILNITQCKNGGGVEMGRYLTGIGLASAGVVSGHDMTTEAAVTKLMFLLGQGLSQQEIRRQLEISLRGELTED